MLIEYLTDAPLNQARIRKSECICALGGFKLNDMRWDFSALVWIYIPALFDSGGIVEENG